MGWTVAAGWGAPDPTQAVSVANRSAPATGGPKVHPALSRRFAETTAGGEVKAWIVFTDKDWGTEVVADRAARALVSTYNPRAIERRRLRRTAPGLFDLHDLPVAPRYVQAVKDAGVRVHVESKWINAVSAWGTRERFDRIAELPFVKVIQPVRRGRAVLPEKVETAANPTTGGSGTGGTVSDAAGFYGLSEAQLLQMNLVALHNQGFTGSGVIVGILDTGFQRTHVAFNEPGHPVTIIAEYDFINDDPVTSIQPGDPSSQHSHGTYILGTLGAYKPNELVGGAYDASFIVCKTEDVTAEYPAEEDNYVAGLEFIELNGGDMATSSLGYIDWYTQADLDGMTAVTTLAVNIATANGMPCCTAAGNEGHDTNPAISHLIAPADALQVISCGAVDSTGNIAAFSSDGPTADGRVKPELLARGVSTQTVSSFNDTTYAGVSGTSLSTPLVASAVACLLGAHPEWTVDQLRQRLFATAGDTVLSGGPDPTFVRGYGIIDAFTASSFVDCNGNGIDDATDIANATSLDANGNRIPDECECPATDAPLADPAATIMNRFLAVVPANPGRMTALRVTVVDLPAPMNTLNGAKFWIGPPRTISENSGVVPPSEAPEFPTFETAGLQCSPFLADWGAQGTIFVSGPAIAPGGRYRIQALDAACLTTAESAYSPSLSTTTSQWGDVVRDCTTIPCGPPDGSVDVATDIVALLDKFRNLPSAPIKTRCDLDPQTPDLKITITDVTRALGAFGGSAYPFSAGVVPCSP